MRRRSRLEQEGPGRLSGRYGTFWAGNSFLCPALPRLFALWHGWDLGRNLFSRRDKRETRPFLKSILALTIHIDAVPRKLDCNPFWGIWLAR